MGAKPQRLHYPTILPYLTVRDADKAIRYYTEVFGAKELHRGPSLDGLDVLHAEIQFGTSIVMLGEESSVSICRSPQTLSASTIAVNLQVKNVDKTFNRAVAAGAKPRLKPADMFWGHRYAKLRDPFGHEWSLWSHGEELTADEIAKRAAAFYATGPGARKQRKHRSGKT